MQCSDNRGAMHADIAMECRGIYVRIKLEGSRGMPLQGSLSF